MRRPIIYRCEDPVLARAASVGTSWISKVNELGDLKIPTVFPVEIDPRYQPLFLIKIT